MKISSIFKYEIYSSEELEQLKSFTKENNLKMFVEFDFEKDKIFVYVFITRLVYKVHRNYKNSKWFVELKKDFPLDFVKSEEDVELYKFERKMENFLVVNSFNEDIISQELPKIEEVENILKTPKVAKVQTSDTETGKTELEQKTKRRKRKVAKQELHDGEQKEEKKESKRRRKRK